MINALAVSICEAVFFWGWRGGRFFLGENFFKPNQHNLAATHART